MNSNMNSGKEYYKSNLFNFIKSLKDQILKDQIKTRITNYLKQQKQIVANSRFTDLLEYACQHQKQKVCQLLDVCVYVCIRFEWTDQIKIFANHGYDFETTIKWIQLEEQNIAILYGHFCSAQQIIQSSHFQYQFKEYKQYQKIRKQLNIKLVNYAKYINQLTNLMNNKNKQNLIKLPRQKQGIKYKKYLHVPKQKQIQDEGCLCCFTRIFYPEKPEQDSELIQQILIYKRMYQMQIKQKQRQYYQLKQTKIKKRQMIQQLTEIKQNQTQLYQLKQKQLDIFVIKQQLQQLQVKIKGKYFSQSIKSQLEKSYCKFKCYSQQQNNQVQKFWIQVLTLDIKLNGGQLVKQIHQYYQPATLQLIYQSGKNTIGKMTIKFVYSQEKQEKKEKQKQNKSKFDTLKVVKV